MGPDVTCDGFHQDRQVRIQTHVHSDHMGEFSTSKSRELVMSPPVKDLLVFDHPDFEFRANIHLLSSTEIWQYRSSRISLKPAGHMLGASQAVVELADGRRLGYSGDFSWPLDNPIQVDALVVDATYGSPDSNRSYGQQLADEKLVDLVRDQLKLGPIQLLGNSAVIERALMVICSSEIAMDVPLLANARLSASIEVHRRHGWPISSVTAVDHEDGHRAIGEGMYIRCWQLSEGGRVDGIVEGTTISLTKYRAHHVVETLGESNFRVGMSNHADFGGTLEYVQQTGAKFVVTDACRTSHDRARVLANALHQELGIVAVPSSNARRHRWEQSEG